MNDKLDEIKREVNKLDALSEVMIESPDENKANLGIIIKDIIEKIVTLLETIDQK